MKKMKLICLALFALMTVSVSLSAVTAVWGHGEGTRIVPESLTVKAGSKLKVTVNGLVGTKTATFQLTGIFGKYELGEFKISSDDFTKVLQIPVGTVKSRLHRARCILKEKLADLVSER